MIDLTNTAKHDPMTLPAATAINPFRRMNAVKEITSTFIAGGMEVYVNMVRHFVRCLNVNICTF